MTRNRPGTPGAAAPLAATAVVLACTGFLHFHRLPEAPRPADFRAADGTARPYLALIVAQPGDCADGTAHLQLLNTPELRARMGVGALLIGNREELGDAGRTLERRFGELPVRLATRRNLAGLRALRVPATPYLLVMEASGTIVLTAAAPRDREEADRLRRSLSLLTSTEVADAGA